MLGLSSEGSPGSLPALSHTASLGPPTEQWHPGTLSHHLGLAQPSHSPHPCTHTSTMMTMSFGEEAPWMYLQGAEGGQQGQLPAGCSPSLLCQGTGSRAESAHAPMAAVTPWRGAGTRWQQVSGGGDVARRGMARQTASDPPLGTVSV